MAVTLCRIAAQWSRSGGFVVAVVQASSPRPSIDLVCRLMEVVFEFFVVVVAANLSLSVVFGALTCCLTRHAFDLVLAMTFGFIVGL